MREAPEAGGREGGCKSPVPAAAPSPVSCVLHPGLLFPAAPWPEPLSVPTVGVRLLQGGITCWGWGWAMTGLQGCWGLVSTGGDSV